MIEVKAKALGYFGGRRRRPGEVFLVDDKSQIGKWMEVLSKRPGRPKRGDVEPEEAIEAGP